MLKEDKQAYFLFIFVIIMLALWPLLRVYLMPLELWLRANIHLVFIALFVEFVILNYGKRRSEKRLENGWTVRGNKKI